MKNEQTAYAICRELDQGSAELDPAITDRLAAARAAALELYPAPARPAVQPMRGVPTRRSGLIEQPSWWQRLAIAGVPAMLLVVGLVGLGQWSEQRRIEQLAELDAAVLLDDLPIAAYADKGFGVYLKNTRQWSGATAYQVATNQPGR